MNIPTRKLILLKSCILIIILMMSFSVGTFQIGAS